MKYINREYGFTFRPPFFDKFSEIKENGAEITKDNFPGRYVIGAGFDYSAINGAMLIGKNGSLWGVKVSYLKHGKWLDNNDFVQNMGLGCANTADGTFAHFSSGPLSLKWLKHNEQGLVLEISARARLRVRVIFYPCYNWPGELSIEGAFVKGRSPYVAVVKGDISLAENNAVYVGRHQVILDDRQEREFFMAQSYNTPIDSANGAFNEAIMEFIINKNQPKVYLYCAVGEGEVLGMDVPRVDKIAKLIRTAELRYGVNRTMGTGMGVAAESMLNSIMWSKIYYPYLLSTIFSPKRSSLNNHFDINGLEENCAALLGAYVGDGTTAEAQLSYALEDKIMAVMSLWHIYSHLKNKSRVLTLYDKLVKIYPPDNELVLSRDADKNEIAYKWSDSPLKEIHNNDIAAYSLDLSCLKLFAFDILERIAIAYGLGEAKAYGLAKRRHVKLINDTFWNEEYGIYMNRYINGTWPLHYGATSFYPLIAGAVDDADKLTKLVNNLTNPKKFWGEYVVPTLSKDDKYYGKKGRPNSYGRCEPPYLQYRGSIVPYVNYIIYHGLVRYGLDEIAGEFARKSARLWSDNDSKNVENYSLYLPNGKRVKQRGILSNNGNMLALMGTQELIDIDYFRDDLKTALRFGTFARGYHSLTNLKLLGRAYSIDVNNNQTTLLVNNGSVFIGDGGRFVVRQFLETESGCEFIVDAHDNINIQISLPFARDEVAKSMRSFSVPTGKSKVSIQGDKLNISLI